MHNSVALAAVLVLVPQQERVFCRNIFPRTHLSPLDDHHSHFLNGASDSDLYSGHHHVERRDSRLTTSLQPFYVSASNTVYGGYSSKSLRLESKSGRLNIGSLSFYQQDLYSYIKEGTTPDGIYGFAAHFDPQSSPSDYTFFKSISNGRGALQARDFPTHQPRSIRSNFLPRKTYPSLERREDDRVQCRNQNGESALFSKHDCSSAAEKMTAEKTAMSTCGGCQLILIGPQGQLSSSNMPASDLQMHASNILDGCVTGPRGQPTSLKLDSKSSIPSNSKPTFVLLLAKGGGSQSNCT